MEFGVVDASMSGLKRDVSRRGGAVEPLAQHGQAGAEPQI